MKHEPRLIACSRAQLREKQIRFTSLRSPGYSILPRTANLRGNIVEFL